MSTYPEETGDRWRRWTPVLIAAGQGREIDDLHKIAGLARRIVGWPHQQRGRPGEYRQHRAVLHGVGLDGEAAVRRAGELGTHIVLARVVGLQIDSQARRVGA